jgi:hypothetical protein
MTRSISSQDNTSHEMTKTLMPIGMATCVRRKEVHGFPIDDKGDCQLAALDQLASIFATATMD